MQNTTTVATGLSDVQTTTTVATGLSDVETTTAVATFLSDVQTTSTVATEVYQMFKLPQYLLVYQMFELLPQ